MDVNAPRGVLRFFADMEDPRSPQGRRHDLLAMIVIAISAVICGASGWQDVALFGVSHEPWFASFLRLPHGIPSHDTFGRVFARLAPERFEERFLAWARSLAQATLGRLVALDGKTIRRSFDAAAGQSALHMISAWCESNQTVLGQIVTAAKSNEITAIPQLLELLDLEGAVVTTDAMGCQKAIAEKIITCGADYVLQVKGNHPHLEQELEKLFAECRRGDPYAAAHEYAEDVDKGHGRIETRRCWMTTDVAWLPGGAAWASLGSLVCVEATRQTKEGVTTEQRYYISSIEKLDAARMLQRVRGHWGIENRVHWCLDVTFGEDQRRLRRGHAAENFSRLSRIALNLLKRADTGLAKGRSIRARRLLAAWDPDYLLSVLTHDPSAEN
jgi:predicted transposase YbfD/YdcC